MLLQVIFQISQLLELFSKNIEKIVDSLENSRLIELTADSIIVKG